LFRKEKGFIVFLKRNLSNMLHVILFPTNSFQNYNFLIFDPQTHKISLGFFEKFISGEVQFSLSEIRIREKFKDI